MMWSRRMFEALVREMFTITLTSASVEQSQRRHRLLCACDYLIRRTQRPEWAELETLVQT